MAVKINPVDVQVGKAIKAQRVLKQVSQTELGERIGVTFQQIQKYENGTNRIATSKLIELARALDVDVRTFLDDFAPDSGALREGPSPQEQFIVSREAVLLHNAFVSIADRDTRKHILKIVQKLASGEKYADIGEEQRQSASRG